MIGAGSIVRSALLVLLVSGVAACGGGGSKESAGSVGGALPSCADSGAPHDLPAVFPTGFPLPEGTLIESTRKESEFSIAEGYVPGDLEATADYFRERLPEAGYELGEGDAEEHEAETEFEGNGIDGRLKLRSVDGCEGALSLTLAAMRS